ncbi:hypothetical protein Dsin_029521 [Dipteronia sinensis]|uniref:Peptidase A1 domain-containing protein n=1 Tax=Dipteronia sinensis TaxID=43782 RepID=A0AAD9ZSP3_9ROSI|nr:hypothetical protein Dsin_029521 [Dipteronia sinensis]
MASSSSSSLHLLSFFFTIVLAFISVSSGTFKPPKPRVFIFPIKRDEKTHQFYTELDMGTTNRIDVVIDLGGQFSWLDCDQYNSSTYRHVRCWSPKCKATIGGDGASCIDCKEKPHRPGCTRNTCALSSYNPKTNMYKVGGVGEDTMRVSSTDGYVYLTDEDMRRFTFGCGVKGLLSGLAKPTKGILGLGRTPSSLSTQFSSAFKLVQNKFALCLPSPRQVYSGDIFVGGGPYYFVNYMGDASNLLIKTPLVINPVSYPRPLLNSKDFSSPEYFIDVKGIKVDGKPVISFNTSLLSIDNEGKGGTMISTMTYYTVLHSAIYKALVTEFVNEAAAKKMKRVGSVAPFGACFSSENIKNNMTGPAVPIIDLVVKGNNAPWRIYGANSMVKVNKNVLCLGFVDGGSTPITSIILGGHQLENNLLEFDLESSMVGFSSSLLLHYATCSQSRIF